MVYYILFQIRLAAIVSEPPKAKGLASLIGVQAHHFSLRPTYAPVALELFVGEIFNGYVACGCAGVFFIGVNLYKKLFAAKVAVLTDYLKPESQCLFHFCLPLFHFCDYIIACLLEVVKGVFQNILYIISGYK